MQEKDFSKSFIYIAFNLFYYHNIFNFILYYTSDYNQQYLQLHSNFNCLEKKYIGKIKFKFTEVLQKNNFLRKNHCFIHINTFQFGSSYYFL